MIPDGIYFLHPDDSAWIAACLRNGRCVAMTEESLMETHDAAKDRWAGIVPMESDLEVDTDIADLVVKAVLPDSDPDLVLVTTPEEIR